MTKISIPFNRPAVTGNEFSYISDSIKRGHTSGDGDFTKKCHRFLEELSGTQKALLTTSCTHALEMAALLLDIQSGDEVIVPSFTFVSTINAFVLRGARAVFCDIRPDTLNINEELLPAFISEQTRAIVVVHYAGVSCEMRPIMELAKQHHIAVIEDNAHGLFGRYHGQYLGTFGAMSTQSFHETKNIQCGEGGALLINDPTYIERAEIIREKGTNRSRFFRGEVDKYTWVDVGSSYLLSDLLAAYLYAQLENWELIQQKRMQIWNTYQTELTQSADAQDIRMPIIPEHCDQSYHMFYLILPDLQARTHLIDTLKNQGILSTFHYQSLHLSHMGRKHGGRKGDCPVTERVSDTLVRLPFYYDLTESQQARVIEVIKGIQVRA